MADGLGLLKRDLLPWVRLPVATTIDTVNPVTRSETSEPRRVRGFLVVVAAIVGTAGCQGATVANHSAGPAPTTFAGGPVPDAPVGNPWPQIGAAPPGHHAILAMGDSLMGGTLYTLPGVLAAHGFDAVVYDGHVSASGLLDPMNGYLARDYLALQLAAHPDVDTVIFEWAGVCDDVCGTDALRYGSNEFFAAWQDAAGDLIRDARLRGLKVVWAISPPPPPDLDGDVPVEDWSSQAMREFVTTLAATYERNYPTDFGVTTADWWQALSDTSGHWQQSLSYDGSSHAVRAPDRVHLTVDGSTRTSTWTVAALAAVYQR
jgi:hypothetical protein